MVYQPNNFDKSSTLSFVLFFLLKELFTTYQWLAYYCQFSSNLGKKGAEYDNLNGAPIAKKSIGKVAGFIQNSLEVVGIVHTYLNSFCSLSSVLQSMKAQEKPVKRRHPPVIFASLVQNVMKMPRMSGNVLFYSFKENNDSN